MSLHQGPWDPGSGERAAPGGRSPTFWESGGGAPRNFLLVLRESGCDGLFINRLAMLRIKDPCVKMRSWQHRSESNSKVCQAQATVQTLSATPDKG